MRQVAHEERLAPFARYDLGPLVPGRRLAVGEEEIDRAPCTLAPAQPHERGDVAPFVRRIGVPLPLAVAALLELAPVTLEGVVEQVFRQPALLAARRERDR